MDSRNEMATAPNTLYQPTTAMLLPTTGPTAASCFPYFPQGYGSGSALERANHPAAYSVYKSALYNSSAPDNNLVFRPSDMEALLRPNSLTKAADTGSSTLISQLLRLCPTGLGGPDIFPTTPPNTIDTSIQRRNWITTISSDLARPGLSPWLFNPSNPAFNPTAPSNYSTYLISATAAAATATTPSLGPDLPPVGMFPVGTPNQYIPFPSIAQLSASVPGQPNPPVASEFLSGQAADAVALLGSAVGRIDLNRPLPPYPHMSSGATAQMTTTPNDRFDVASASSTLAQIQAQFLAARLAREQLAIDIYLRLLAVAGVAPPSNLANPLPTDIQPRRWLAQLAVNIVDYIDADEISTPFNFYNPANGPYGLPLLNNYNTQLTPTNSTLPVFSTGNPDVPAYWVFGTELPRIVISEVLGEYSLPTDNGTPNGNPKGPNAKAGNFNVNMWVELFNTMPATAAITGPTGYQTVNGSTLQPQDSLPVPLYIPTGPTPAYNPYQLIIANNGETLANSTLVPYSHGLWYDQKTATSTPPGPGLNNNVLGTPQQLRYNASGAIAGSNFNDGNGSAWTVGSPPPAGNPPAASATYPLIPPSGLAGQSCMLVGPAFSNNANDINKDIPAKGTPPTTLLMQSPSMQYQVTFTPPNTWTITLPGTNTPVTIYDNINGVSVLLRRLANPHLPYNPYSAAGTLTYPAYPFNPYITVDYVHGVQLNGYIGSNGQPIPISKANNPPTPNGVPVPPGPASYGKLQPYAAHLSQYVLQTTPQGAVNHHTLGLPNWLPTNTATVPPTPNPFTWLVHLDRPLISPMELLHVSGFHPHQLTQRFIFVPNTNTIPISQPYGNPGQYPATSGAPASYFFQHYVPWFDQSRRLYRIFEFLETHNGMSGISTVNGRVPGKVNINTLWDVPLANPTTNPTPLYPQIYQALYDSSGTFSNTNYSATAANLLIQTLLTRRTPGLAAGTLSAVDNPLVGMAAGVAPVPPMDLQYPNGMGINHTLFTDNQLDATASAINPRVLQIPNAVPTNPQGADPYMQMELMNKIYNRLTTRSNVYAVFLTVGFFQVTPGTTPPKLGAEIGLSEGRNVRHRMFAIVDRTNLSVFTTTTTVSATSPIVAAPLAGQVTPATLMLNGPTSGVNANTGAPWSIQVGTQLVIEPGTANEETVIVTAVNTPPGTAPNTTNTPLPNFTANFTLMHPNSAMTGNTSVTYAISQRGNPGPWTLQPYDPRKDSSVVLYYNIID